jgi:hypothetical protein
MMPNRRVFLASTAVATLAAGVGAVPMTAQRRRGDQRQADDAVLDEITRQLEQAVRAMAKAPRGETARQLAATNRLLAAWATQIDQPLRGALARVVAREGRASVLARQLDFRAETKLRGWDLPHLPFADVSPADRARVLDEVLARGISGGLTRLADMWDAAAPGLDRRAGTVALASLQHPECVTAQAALAWAKFIALIMCAPPLVFEPAGPALCAVAQAEVLAVELYIWWYGC